MSRQRIINDANFWRSPRVADCTQEDKATLLYLLTSPSSNMIGVYSIVPRIAAAEMGWTAEQLIPVLRRLSVSGLIEFDEQQGYVWVKIWWEHNSAKLAVSSKLLNVTISQIEKIPEAWRATYTNFLMSYIVPERRVQLSAAIVERGMFSLVEHPKRYHIGDCDVTRQGLDADAASRQSDRVSVDNNIDALAHDRVSQDDDTPSTSDSYRFKSSFNNNNKSIGIESPAAIRGSEVVDNSERRGRELEIARLALATMTKSL